MISVEDMNVAMKDGLGTRYAFVGPLEACHLNAEGNIPSYYCNTQANIHPMTKT